MNIYDFDHTIYNGDSTIDFFKFLIKKKPSILLSAPKQFWGFLLYGIKKIDKTELKEYFFSFLTNVDVDLYIEEFWSLHKNKIFDWYKNQMSETDIIISASPHFLLEPIMNQLKTKNLIASKVNKKTGKFDGKNCYGEEKVKRLIEEMNISSCEKFYSDSYSDAPLARISREAYLIKNGKIYNWEVQ